ncbi:MAG: TonB-dependent receptor [Bacteroidota bacterium]
MKSFAFLLLLVFATLPVSAQTPEKTIYGTVKDLQNEAIPGATVYLHRAADSVLVMAGTSNSSGKFEFKGLTKQVYYLRVSSVGSASYSGGSLTIDEQHPTISLPAILLSPSQMMLKEVTVAAKRPLLEQDIDKTIVNVEAMIGSASSNTLEVLAKTPGITVGTDGEISLNGKSGVLVLIDGRQTYLSGQDLAAYLRSLPGGSLNKLELMTNPPAKYDAAGSAIINIRLKRNRTPGFTGDVVASYSQGKTARGNEVLNLNLNRNKINLFASAGYSQDGNYTDDFYHRTFYESNSTSTSSVQLQNHDRYTSQGVTTRLGMDYAASPKTTYGFLVSYQNQPKQEELTYTNKSFNTSQSLDSTGSGVTNSDYSWENVSANLNYQHRFGQAGREITADLNYLSYRSNSHQRLNNSVLLPDGTLSNQHEFLYVLPSDILIYTAKADYVHPLANKAVLEVGFKSSLVSTDNDSQYYTVTTVVNRPNYGQSNHFIYWENINAAYVNTRKEWRRIALQAGLRLENTQANGHQLGNAEVAESSFDKLYTRVFPTAFVRYKLDTAGLYTLAISVARRINRPNYQLLNPFVFFQDTYSYTSGNPLLKPQYHYQYELKYQHESYLGIALQYNHFTDVIFQMTQVDGNLFFTRPNNVAKGYILALAVNLSLTPTKWWRFNTNLTFANLTLRGQAYSEKLATNINNARLNVVNQFNFKKGWSAELTGYYSTKALAGQRVTDPRYRVGAAIQKKVLKEKGSVRLVMEDIFHSWQQNDRTVSLRQADAYHINQSDTRRIGLAFTYRFGKETFARKRHHTDNAADTEKGRVD